MIQQEHILVIRLSAMGDVAMTVPVLRALVAQHPNLKITVVSKPFLKPLFKDIPQIDFFAADVKERHKGLFGLYRLFKDTKNLGVTKVADLHNVLRSKILRSFYLFAGFKVRSIDKGRAEKKALTREENKVFKQLKTSHERYADVFNNLGFPVDLSKVAPLSPKKLTGSTIELTGKKDSTWIGIAPFAAFSGKMYPLDLMKEVIKELANTNKVLLFGGGQHEIEQLKAIETAFDNVICVAGILSFDEELALISNLDVMLAMDSGNAHLAAIQGIETVTLWGVTHPFAGFAPFDQSQHCVLPDLKQYPKIPCSVYGNKVVEGYEDVMRTIAPKTVVAEITKVLTQ